MTITVTNKHWDKSEGVYIGRPFLLGNPYSHLPKTQAQYKVGSREEAIKAYEARIRSQINVDMDITRALKQLYQQWKRDGHLTLICWCTPAGCHGDVLKAILEEKEQRCTQT